MSLDEGLWENEEFDVTLWKSIPRVSPRKMRKNENKAKTLYVLVAGGGFEPPTFRLWAWQATVLLYPAPRKVKCGDIYIEEAQQPM